jgi:UDP-glucose 4-epimerase
MLSLTSDFIGHEVFYIVAPFTVVTEASRQLAQTYYPDAIIRDNFSGCQSFFDSSKAERILGWSHEDDRHAHS